MKLVDVAAGGVESEQAASNTTAVSMTPAYRVYTNSPPLIDIASPMRPIWPGRAGHLNRLR